MKRLTLSILLVLLFAISGYSQAQAPPFTGCTPGTVRVHIVGALPAFDAQATSATTCILGIYLTNLTSGDLIVTMHDVASLFFYSLVVPANSSAPPFNFPNGLQFDGGLFWQASGPGVVISLNAVQ